MDVLVLLEQQNCSCWRRRHKNKTLKEVSVSWVLYFFGGLRLVMLVPYWWYGQRNMTVHWFSVSAGIMFEHQPP